MPAHIGSSKPSPHRPPQQRALFGKGRCCARRFLRRTVAADISCRLLDRVIILNMDCSGVRHELFDHAAIVDQRTVAAAQPARKLAIGCDSCTKADCAPGSAQFWSYFRAAGQDSRAPEASALATPNAGRTGMPEDRAGGIALTGMGIFSFAIAGEGAFIERIGVTPNVGLEAIGLAILVYGILSIFGPMTAGAVVDATGYQGPGWFMVAILIIALALMAIATTKADVIRENGEAA
jgi:hypothetical protein